MYKEIEEKLKIDCKQCKGLCCIALYCAKIDGFPENKEAGVPCKYLMQDFRCKIHKELASKNMRGCLAYDCFGAGQKVTQSYCQNVSRGEAYKIFLTVFQLHQIEWYLLESLSLVNDENIKKEIEQLIIQNEKMTSLPSVKIIKLDIVEYRLRVNEILKSISALVSDKFSRKTKVENKKDFFAKDFYNADLSGTDFSMAILIAANLKGCNLNKANFLGADIRDANICNADLSSSVFLTQMQINSAKGNSNTKLPSRIVKPLFWD